VKFPKSLKIGPYVWAVDRPKRIRRREGDGVRDRWGEIDYTAETIRVVDYAGPSQRVETLLHEALHAVAYAYGLGEDVLSEETIGRLSPGITDMLITNGLLVDFEFTDVEREEWLAAVDRHNRATDSVGLIDF
jgi:hypothetical protein